MHLAVFRSTQKRKLEQRSGVCRAQDESSSEGTSRGLQLYRGHECLWNTTRPDYHNEALRRKARESMVEALGIPGLAESVVAAKIKTIRASNARELVRLQGLSRSGAGAEEQEERGPPWFEEAEFLRKVVKPRQSSCYLRVSTLSKFLIFLSFILDGNNH